VTEEKIKFLLLLWGAGLSTILGLIKLWETFWRDRVKLSTTYSFTGAQGVADEITVVNRSDQPVQVSHWSLAWESKLLHRSKTLEDLTPYEGGGRFVIDSKAEHTLYFSEGDKFDWGWKAAEGREMYLRLFLFGRRRPIKLRIKSQ
jgi:hypothetical protein